MKPYTYLLHHKPTNTFYYGVRYGNGCLPSDFWKTYFTSSRKIIPLLRTLFGNDSFEFEIRRVFKTKEAALVWEHKVLRRMKVTKKTNIWLNRTDNHCILRTEEMNFIQGNRQKNSIWVNNQNVEKQIERIDDLPLGFVVGRLPFSYDQRNKMSNNVKGNKNPMFGRHIRFDDNRKLAARNTAKRIGSTPPSSRGKRWYNDGTIEKLLKVEPERVSSWWKVGRLSKILKIGRAHV